MKFETHPISELIDEISMGPFGSNIKVECFVDEGIPVLNGSNLEGYELKEGYCNYSPRYIRTNCIYSSNLKI